MRTFQQGDGLGGCVVRHISSGNSDWWVHTYLKYTWCRNYVTWSLSIHAFLRSPPLLQKSQTSPSLHLPPSSMMIAIRTVAIPLPVSPQSNGPIRCHDDSANRNHFCSHYRVVVILHPVSQTEAKLGNPDTPFDSLDNFDTRVSATRSSAQPRPTYITAEFGTGLLPSSRFFIVGGGARPQCTQWLSLRQRLPLLQQALCLLCVCLSLLDQTNTLVRPLS